jgi:hypothetical protein
MLRGITLDGFRSFAESTWLDLAPITVLAGANNVGKSSVLASLASLVQSAEQSSQSALLLCGDWTVLGRFDEVVSYHRTGDSRAFDLGIVGDGPEGTIDVTWHFEAAPGDQREIAICTQVEFSTGGPAQRLVARPREHMRWERLDESGEKWNEAGMGEMLGPATLRMWTMATSETIQVMPLTPSTFRYLGPYRTDPKDFYRGRSRPQGPPLGRDGSFTAEYLFRRRHQTVDLLPEPGPAILLGHALNVWWSYIFALPIKVRVNELERIGYTLKVDTPSAENLGLGMVGLGLSQALPVVALVIGSSPGDVIAIETPEAHLHPGAQHRLAQLLIAAVRAGRQVILETHSEHVVNAVRLAVKAGELTPDQVAIHFFGLDGEGATTTTRIDLDASGRAMTWPEGFFDQGAKELAELLG